MSYATSMYKYWLFTKIDEKIIKMYNLIWQSNGSPLMTCVYKHAAKICNNRPANQKLLKLLSVVPPLPIVCTLDKIAFKII